MFNADITQKFEEYETLKTQVKIAEERIKELQPILMEQVPEGKEIEGKAGVFYVQNRSKWEYTDKVKQAKKSLDELKKDEEATGDANHTFIPTLYFRVNKDEE